MQRKIDQLNEQLSKLSTENIDIKDKYSQACSKISKLSENVDSLTGLISKLQQECAEMAKERDSETMKWEISQNHMDTKIRLLKEVLTRKNKDYQIAEDNNKELVAFIEKCDEKITKLDEDLQIEKIKSEKYEIKLGLIEDDFKRIDVDTLDGRINFLVNLLEQYRKMLEDESLLSNSQSTAREKTGESHANKPKRTKPRDPADIDDEDKIAMMYAKQRRQASI